MQFIQISKDHGLNFHLIQLMGNYVYLKEKVHIRNFI